jgi:Co/Zn/Cd efflux system component
MPPAFVFGAGENRRKNQEFKTRAARRIIPYNAPARKSIEIREHIESDGDSRISDLHLLKVADGKYACIIALVTGMNCSIDDYKKRLEGVHELAHTTIEINRCVKTV